MSIEKLSNVRELISDHDWDKREDALEVTVNTFIERYVKRKSVGWFRKFKIKNLETKSFNCLVSRYLCGVYGQKRMSGVEIFIYTSAIDSMDGQYCTTPLY